MHLHRQVVTIFLSVYFFLQMLVFGSFLLFLDIASLLWIPRYLKLCANSSTQSKQCFADSYMKRGAVAPPTKRQAACRVKLQDHTSFMHVEIGNLTLPTVCS